MNPFPESAEKAYLRLYHLNNFLAPFAESLGRKLAYFGLPSAEMRDVRLWIQILGRVTAVEREPSVALEMLRTAQDVGIRSETIPLEMELSEVSSIMAQDEHVVEHSLSTFSAPVADRIRAARSIAYDILNIDMCGGFLYPKKTLESEYEQTIRNLVRYQSKQRASFFLILTFNTRDAGKAEYDSFIASTLKFLEGKGQDVAKLRKYYTATSIKGHPPNLRRLRFCVPTYLHKISYEDFEVQGEASWYYKTFFHTILFFQVRQEKRVLGMWPPPEEVLSLLTVPLYKIAASGEAIDLVELTAPVPT